MRIKDIESESKTISMLDFENFFDVSKDGNGYYRYNLNSNLYLNYSNADFQQYIPTQDLHWSIISYNIYGTTRLAWLLCKINGVSDPILPVPAGTPVLHLPKETVNQVVQFINI